MNVKAWGEKIIIPTYETGAPEKNPIFLEKRVYQGSSGSVYPYPVVEKIADEKSDKEWQAIYLENQYLKIMILPELGGRIQMAYDKIKQRHFVYYNSVIKPALVGLTGPWISGGIEFNWPQHHRPSTYEAVEALIEENQDGSVTVWCNELERMFRTRGRAGFTLHPDKAYLQIKVKLFNGTPHPQTFLWWANPAVKVNDHYQSVFPPDVNAVFDHGKRDVASFPIATGHYYKVDYSAGVDISRYKNIPAPTSYMAIQSKYDFVGGYENDTQAGLLHVADHHVSPGKKQWTWGHGDFGRAWDRNLTDEDGPYIELMCGVYTDNQPDFAWLQPYEEKSFEQYFMPYRDLGLVKNATRDALLNIEVEAGGLRLKLYTTGTFPKAQVVVKKGEKLLLDTQIDTSPAMSFNELIPDETELSDLHVALLSKDGKVLVDWQAEPETLQPMPEPAQAAKDPEDLRSVDQLYLQGLHLEQYRHATYDPRDYYLEALKREPEDWRCNNAMGLWLLRRGCLQDAEPFLRKAVNTLTQRNPNPYEGEALYHLGLCLRLQGKDEEAYRWFNKAAWNAAWVDSASFQAARMAIERGDLGKALELTNRSLARNSNNPKAHHLKTLALRLEGQKTEALQEAENALAMDPFNHGLRFELWLLTGSAAHLKEVQGLAGPNIHTCLEYALDYAHAGRFKEACAFLEKVADVKGQTYPMTHYLTGYFELRQGKRDMAGKTFEKAAACSPDYCFPNKTEELLALEAAVNLRPGDDKAWYYMGNFWYGTRQHNRALQCWEQSRSLNDRFPTVHRNLALAYYNKQNKPEAALQALEKAFALATTDARVLMELDQLYKKCNKSPQERLSLLQKHPEQVAFRDDLFLELISLYNLTGKADRALALLLQRRFHPWEGGEGKVTGQYLLARTQLAQKALQQKDYPSALSHLEACFSYPHNLGEGKLPTALENDTHYWLGITHQAMGLSAEAISCWEKAAQGNIEASVALYYNDQQSDQLFYQGLALRALGREEEARSRFFKLLKYGEKHLFIPFKMDYFAVSLPDLLIFEEDLQKRQLQNCRYLMGLGLLGLGQKEKARTQLEQVLFENRYHQGAWLHQQLFDL